MSHTATDMISSQVRKYTKFLSWILRMKVLDQKAVELHISTDCSQSKRIMQTHKKGLFVDQDMTLKALQTKK